MTVPGQVTVNTLRFYNLVNEINRVQRRLPEEAAFLLPVPFEDGLDALLEARGGHAPIAGTGPPANCVPLQHGRCGPAFGQHTGRVQSGVASPDDGHIHLRGQGGRYG